MIYIQSPKIFAYMRDLSGNSFCVVYCIYRYVSTCCIKSTYLLCHLPSKMRGDSRLLHSTINQVWKKKQVSITLPGYLWLGNNNFRSGHHSDSYLPVPHSFMWISCLGRASGHATEVNLAVFPFKRQDRMNSLTLFTRQTFLTFSRALCGFASVTPCCLCLLSERAGGWPWV